jgi:hypothetical protein
VTANSNGASGRAGAPSGSSQSSLSRAKPLIPDAKKEDELREIMRAMIEGVHE